MKIELILPAEMTLKDLADRLAGAVWSVLKEDVREQPIYQGHFDQVTGAILDRLNDMCEGEEQAGGLRSVRLSCDAPPASDALEAGLTRAIAGRVTGVLSDLRAVRLITHDLPSALGDVLRPYEWIDDGLGEARPAPGL